MEVTTQLVKQITLLDREVELFSSIIDKLSKESKRTGFNNKFSEEERELISELKEANDRWLNNKEGKSEEIK